MISRNTHAAALTRRGVLAAGAGSVILAGCGGGLLSPSQDPLQIYVLKPPLQKLEGLPEVAWQLTIAEPDVEQSLQTVRIALQRGQMMDFFANAQWTDPTPELLQSLLVQAFETSGCIRGVGRESEGIRGDVVLETEIRSFQANYQDETGAPDIVVAIAGRLLTSGRGQVVGTFVTSYDVRASQNSVPAVVEAFDKATGQSLEDVVRWTLTAGQANGVVSKRS